MEESATIVVACRAMNDAALKPAARRNSVTFSRDSYAGGDGEWERGGRNAGEVGVLGPPETQCPPLFLPATQCSTLHAAGRKSVDWKGSGDRPSLQSRAQLLMQQVHLPPSRSNSSYNRAPSSMSRQRNLSGQSRKSDGSQATIERAPSAPGFPWPRTLSSPGELCAPEDSAQPCTLLPKMYPASLSAPPTGPRSLEESLLSLADEDLSSCIVQTKGSSLSSAEDAVYPLSTPDLPARPYLEPFAGNTAKRQTFKKHDCWPLEPLTVALEGTEQHQHNQLPADAGQPLPSPFRHVDVPHALFFGFLSEPANDLTKKRRARLSRAVSWRAEKNSTSFSQGKRASLRSSTIMLRQPLQRLYGMQASDIDIYRKVTRDKTSTMGSSRSSTSPQSLRSKSSPAPHMEQPSS